mgnify:CR=1 FL=1
MKTDDLITMLATGATAVDTGAVWRRLAWATGLGILGAAFLMFTLLGVRADLAAAALDPRTRDKL